MKVVLSPRKQPGASADPPAADTLTLTEVGNPFSGMALIRSWSLKTSEMSRQYKIPSLPRLTLDINDFYINGASFWRDYLKKYRFLNKSSVDILLDDGTRYKIFVNKFSRDVATGNLKIEASILGDFDGLFPIRRFIRLAWSADKEDTKIILFGDYRNGFLDKDGTTRIPLTGKILSLGKELMHVLSVKTDALVREGTEIEVARGYLNTKASSLKQGKELTVCNYYRETGILDICKEILEASGFEINNTFDSTDYNTSLRSYVVSATLLYEKKRKVKDLLEELSQAYLMRFFIDNEGKVGVRHIINVNQPEIKTLTQKEHIVKGSLKYQDDTFKSNSRVAYYYDLEEINDYKNDEEKFTKSKVRVSGELLGGLEDYDKEREHYSRWYGSTLSETNVERQIEVEKTGNSQIKLDVAGKDIAGLSIGDNIKIESDLLDENSHEYIVISVQPSSDRKVTIEALRTPFRAGATDRIRFGISRIGGDDSYI